MTPTPATGAAAELPVVAYGRWAEGVPAGERLMKYDGAPDVRFERSEHYPVALTPHAPAQSQLEALREEVARLKAEFTENAELMHRQYVEQSLLVARLTKERDELRAAGAPMANTMFNLAQKPGYILTESDCALFKRMQVAWDDTLRTALAARKEPT